MATFRDARLTGFVALLKAEGRRAVLGLDCGRGADGLAFVQAGIHFTGVDSSEENVQAARARGLEASVAQASSLPFASAAFPAVWAVDALAGLPPAECVGVIAELGRVAGPGSPIAVVLAESRSQDPHGVAGVLHDHATERFTVLRSPGPDGPA
ncbi:bifunctional 2-polyprenyl-6-hydroxyphenol methylase/3-demethylubiquinol 3-O-methyltransferase UbiG [Arthrobacter sp. PAMC25284]|uniref:class I SAM-dependent methyltransferase n=1 Tax=Arthrobacter sp. PAMC25284 TaxID=2861279 RepID=UPI001C630997|nr:class I SAM-dependent methyltransferase [Arthrobacter sp. PAMC25284]QYF90992.1 class I SAM-dependent methyltransferase [Arthrobacter sp. PAMC25284]